MVSIIRDIPCETLSRQPKGTHGVRFTALNRKMRSSRIRWGWHTKCLLHDTFASVKNAFNNVDLENGHIGSVTKLSGFRGEVQ